MLHLVCAATFVAPSRQAHGQALIDAKSATSLRDQYTADLDTVHVKIMALANAIPADNTPGGQRPGYGLSLER